MFTKDAFHIHKLLLLLLLLFTVSVVTTDAARISSLINADLVEINTFPYLVSLSYNGDHMCGGSIITSRHILTAAHCVVSNTVQVDASRLQVRAGSLDRTNLGWVYYVENCLYHVSYNPKLDTSPYDIAVVKLTSRIEFNEYVQPISMTRLEPPPNAIMTSVGWGKTDSRHIGFPIRAYSGYFRSLSSQQCGQHWGNSFQTGEICASNGTGVSTCRGDSGGPLVYNGELVGVVSYGSLSCIDGRPTVFTSVGHFSRWIETMINYYLMC